LCQDTSGGVHEAAGQSEMAALGRVGDGLYVAAGFSGHGFMIAPAVARIVADAVTGAPPDETLGILDFARFEEGRLVPEPQLV
jgi:glycine/D-amino acid oxidase-like deaminating enzyme